MSLDEEIFQNWEHFWHSRTIRIATQETNSIMVKPSTLPKKSSDRDPAAKSQVSGYGELIVRIDEKMFES